MIKTLEQGQTNNVISYYSTLSKQLLQYMYYIVKAAVVRRVDENRTAASFSRPFVDR
jgi:hypothetical protein